MIFLQTLHASFSTVTAFYRFNSLYSSNSPSERCDVAYLVLQAHFANCFAVFCVIALCLRRVDYKANFLVHNQIYNIRTTTTNFVYNFAFNSIAVVEIGSSLSVNLSKAEIFQ